jgi:hypothetical protein
MTKKRKFRSNVWLVVKSVVAGSVVVSRVFGAPAPITPTHVGLVDDWRIVGRQMGEKPSDLPPLSDHLIDMIASADLKNNLSEIVLASYSMVDADLLTSLDAHWSAVLTSTGNAPLVVEFLNIRSDINIGGVSNTETDTLVWLAKKPLEDGCDGGPSGENNGHGNGDQTAPGGSEAPNNAENSENSGQGNSGRGKKL